MESPQDILRLKHMIEDAGSIVISTHMRPDGDALGSAGAIFWQLSRMGKRAVVVLSDDVSQTLKFMFEGVPYILDPILAEEAIAAADLIVSTDYNGFERAGDALSPILSSRRCGKILIDHHENPKTEQFDLVFSRQAISSASELVYWVLKQMGSEIPIEAARCMMAGMTTDTNNFANSVFPSTLRMASELLDMGVDRDAIISSLYNSYRENRVRAFGRFLSGMKVMDNGVAYIIVRKSDWEELDLREGELEGLVNMPLSIAEVKLCIYLREDGDVFRVSIRSKEGVSALGVARDLFNGGGHIRAAGGKLRIGQDIPSADDAARYIEDNVRI